MSLSEQLAALPDRPGSAGLALREGSPSDVPMSGPRLVDDQHGSALAPPRLTLSPEHAERYRQLVAAHYDPVWRTLRGLGVSSADAEDCAQQVYIIALRRLSAVEPARERSFLLGTAVRVAANARRSQRRSRETPDTEAVAAERDARDNPEQEAVRREQQAILASILETMPDDIREVFVLFELEGLTANEIGDAMAIPFGTVNSRLRRAREHFRDKAARFARGERR